MYAGPPRSLRSALPRVVLAAKLSSTGGEIALTCPAEVFIVDAAPLRPGGAATPVGGRMRCSDVREAKNAESELPLVCADRGGVASAVGARRACVTGADVYMCAQRPPQESCGATLSCWRDRNRVPRKAMRNPRTGRINKKEESEREGS